MQSGTVQPYDFDGLSMALKRPIGASCPLRKRYFSSRRFVHLALIAYGLTIFVGLDFIYSTFINSEASPRIPVKEYDHGLLPNFDGHMRFGEYRYRFYTDSLGFRDYAARQVPLQSVNHRVLLIGDSVTEGMAVTFEQSFAGLLYRAGKERRLPIEFLNAAVASYSPVIYYKKVKYLLDYGLAFDEVVVFSDISDVEDEGTSYFCIDDHPEYRKYCLNSNPSQPGTAHPDFAPSTGMTHSGLWWQEHFVMSDSVRMLVKYGLQRLSDNRRDKSVAWYPRAGWTISGYNVGNDYAPLGVEGGITRSRQNMQELANLLRKRGIPLTIVVYPWPLQLALNDRDSRQERIWHEFCAENCKAFIDLFPDFFAVKDAHDDWYRRLFVYGDLHPSIAGNQLIFQNVRKYLIPN